MLRSLTLAALALAATASLGTADAATLAYRFNLDPGLLTFAVDSTQLTSGGFGTVDPAQGLLSLDLSLGGLAFAATADANYPSFPSVTLVGGNVSFLSFNPANANGTYNLTGFGTGGGSFDYTFTNPAGAQVAGTATAVAAVPEPVSMTVFGVGLLGLAGLRRRPV